MKNLLLGLSLSALVAAPALGANWSYTAFDAASYQPAKDAIKGVEGASNWVDGNGKTYGEVYSDRPMVFSFPAEADISGITLISSWIDAGRVDFAVSGVFVKRTGDADFVKLDAIPAMSFTDSKANGAKAEINADKGCFAKNVNEIKFVFSKLENGFIGMAQVEFRGKMKPVPEKKKEAPKPVAQASAPAPAPTPAVPKVVRPKIKLAPGEWCYDPDAKVLTDGTWTFAAEAQGGAKLNVGSVQGWPKKVTKLDFSTVIKNVYGDQMTIVRLDPRFGRTGPDVEWRRVAGPAAGYVGALKLPGEGLVEIGEMAFCGCTNASGKIVFAKTLKKLENSAFGTAPKLEFEANPLPAGVERLGSGMFEGDHLPEVMSFPYLKTIGGNAFRGTNVKSLSFGKDLKKIESGWGSGPFVNCRELTTINFDPEAKAVDMTGDWVFGDCPKLDALDLTMVDKWSDGAPFQRCELLRSVKLGKKLGKLPKNVFNEAYNIADVHVFGAPGELPKPALPPIRRDCFQKPWPRNTMTTFVHLDKNSPTYAADLAAWGKCTAGGELKTTGSTWSEEYAGKDFADRPLLLWQKPLTISITETQDASELNGTYGWFTISRGDDDPIDCTVPVIFDVGGTAKPGQTYCSLWGDVDIPAGEKSVKVKIRPLNDPKTTTDATVTLTLKPHRYALGKTTKATVTVKNGATYGGYIYADAGKWSLLCHMGNSGNGQFKGNTVAAANWSVNHGFPFENDIQYSKSGVLYLDHDARDRDYPADWPDTFDNTLKCIPKGAVYKVDAKCGTNGLPAMISALKKDKTCDRALITFNAWSREFSEMVHQELPKAQFWYPIMCYGKKEYNIQEEADHIIAACKYMNAEGISMWWVPEVCTDELFAHIAAAGLTIDIWTIDDVRGIKEAVDRGARFITTNSSVPMLKQLPWAAEPVLDHRKPVPPARVNIISK